ncbi:MAG: Nif3-like dinuclear metal center hexameric protein [Tannerellaceae bacterium]|nr:Nif3-like dinuclear metal center hexameric protein [Tannerellaceae bacterium]
MKNNDISRRNFLKLSGAGLVGTLGTGLLLPGQFTHAAGTAKQNGSITAGEVVERIKQNVNIPWRTETVDNLKGNGNPNTVVMGITTTFMGTLDILQKSLKAGNNMIISHEPIFWNHTDIDEGLTGDPVYLHKLDFMTRNGLIVFRFHDHLHGRKPVDSIAEGWNEVMGWENYRYNKEKRMYTLPEPVTLASYAQEVKKRLRSDSVRVVGDPQLIIRTVGMGSNKVPVRDGRLPAADLIFHYEPDRENSVTEYERDIVLSGQQKAFISVSHNRREEDGMGNCARWLRTILPEIPIQFISSEEPFWRTVKK